MDSDAGVWGSRERDTLVTQSTTGHMGGKLILEWGETAAVQFSIVLRHKECFFPNDKGADGEGLAP